MYGNYAKKRQIKKKKKKENRSNSFQVCETDASIQNNRAGRPY